MKSSFIPQESDTVGKYTIHKKVCFFQRELGEGVVADPLEINKQH